MVNKVIIGILFLHISCYNIIIFAFKYGALSMSKLPVNSLAVLLISRGWLLISYNSMRVLYNFVRVVINFMRLYNFMRVIKNYSLLRKSAMITECHKAIIEIFFLLISCVHCIYIIIYYIIVLVSDG